MNADPRRRRHPHDTVEMLARKICDEANGAGHFDAAGTQRNHWRRLAVKALAEAGVPPLIRYFARVFGWM